MVTVSQDIDFSFTDNSLSVQFTDDTDNATSWNWTFGDGNTSTDQNPLHTYANGGVYAVTLETDGGQCDITKVVDLVGVGIEDAITVDLQLQPNPTREQSTLTFSRPLPQSSKIVLLGMDGKVVRNIPHAHGVTQVEVPVDGLAAGMYWIEVQGEVQSKPLKLVVMD